LAAVGVAGWSRLSVAAESTSIQEETAGPERLPIKKGLVWGMLPKELSVADRMKLAKDTGFEEIEAYTESDHQQAEELRRAADAVGIRIHSVMNQAHWRHPLSSSNPEDVQKSLEGMRTSLHNAKLWGAETVLLVPAVVNAETRYEDAWHRSVEQIRSLMPLAEELKVVIAIEEVWNRFLLSPLEFRRYVDLFESPWVKAYFDVGNVVLFGFPQDWIRTLRHRIVKLHLKDFRRKQDGYEWVNLGEGDVDWPEVRKALVEIGYHGSATVELRGGDEAYLRDVSERVDKLLIRG
jgi:hexulose-6-phosphate isomerase